MNSIITFCIFVVTFMQAEALGLLVKKTQSKDIVNSTYQLVSDTDSKIYTHIGIDVNVQKTLVRHSILESSSTVSTENLTPLDGQWGEWGPYDKCSRTCGGGIKKKLRECNNPPPLNGGKPCIGERVKYRSCGIKECPAGSLDFREEQCGMFNGHTFGIQDLSPDVMWHSKYLRIPTDDSCGLYCYTANNIYFKLRSKVIDGTPCGLNTFDICVNGDCLQAGCDHVLNSTAELDACGVCRGDNSTCQRISGSYNSSFYGYTRVARIPAGSSSLDIRQYGWNASHHDNNYLALRLGEHGEYILNGNSMIMQNKLIVRPGISIKYSGPDSIVERLNSSRPIEVDLILEVLSVGYLTPPQIVYEYTVPKTILNDYTWILSEWSNCSRKCHGTTERHAECRSIKNKDVVPDDHCRYEDRPEDEIQLCNSHCIIGFFGVHFLHQNFNSMIDTIR